MLAFGVKRHFRLKRGATPRAIQFNQMTARGAMLRAPACAKPERQSAREHSGEHQRMVGLIQFTNKNAIAVIGNRVLLWQKFSFPGQAAS
jgi:hypothetical protein